MRRMVNCLKAAFKMLRGLPGKVVFLVFLQVATSGIVFVFADVIEPVLYSTLFDGLQNSELSGFLTACAISMVILLVMLAIQYLNDVVLDANVFYAINEMSIRSCEEYHRIPFYRTREMEEGDVYNRINNGADQVVSVWISVMMAFANCLSAAILLGACAGYSLPFFAAAVCVSLTAILRVRIRMKQADDYSRRNEAVMSRFESARYSAIYDMEACVVDGVEEHVLAAYRRQRKLYWDEKKRDARRESLVSAAAETAEHLFRSAAPLSLLAGSRSSLTYGSATSALSVFDSLRDSVPYLSELMAGVAKSFVPIERLQELLVQDAGGQETDWGMGGREPAVCVKDLSFSRGNRQILTNLSLDIPYGQKVALIGKNGCGKSTLLRLIMGYLKPDAGYAAISEMPVCFAPQDAKRAVFSYAPAHPQLFSESVKENIAMGADAHETASAAAAAEKACVPADILEAGGDTLSGGQAMRTNLARAFVHGAPILILDEPTSSVEAGQGREIMRNVLRGSKNTVLATTHEPSYLPWFDRIILLENGRKVCDGPYEEVAKTREYQEWAGGCHSQQVL